MDVDAHLRQLAVDGPTLAAAAQRAGWDAPVRGTEWDVRQLVTHVGGVHRWAADVVRTNASTPETEAGRAVGSGPADDELLDWFVVGHQQLLTALRDAPHDVECFTFLPAASPLAFWARRQAHETAIHRADAQGAAGIRATFDAAFAQDGIAELTQGFAARKSNAIDRAATLALQASDGDSWLLRFGGERIQAECAAAGAGSAADTTADVDATVSGTSAELYLWLWNRPAQVTISGALDVAELWQNVRVRWN